MTVSLWDAAPAIFCERKNACSGHLDARKAENLLRKIDRRRENFYSINTGGNWYDKANYSLCLNSGELGVALAAKLIVDAAKETIYQ